MKSAKTPTKCKECKHFHTTGVKNGTNDRWCIKFSKKASDAIGHCKTVKGFELRGER